ncbi:hypothetical protein ES705_07657 [subsurface metagenome]
MNEIYYLRKTYVSSIVTTGLAQYIFFGESRTFNKSAG